MINFFFIKGLSVYVAGTSHIFYFELNSYEAPIVILIFKESSGIALNQLNYQNPT